MSRDYITESFLAGELNEAWRYLEFCRHVLPGTEADIQQLKNVILRYATVTPYPLLEGEVPDSFQVRFFPVEHGNFHYFLGVGQAFAEGSERIDGCAFDMEKAVTERVIAYAKEKDAADKARLRRGHARLIDFLASYEGESPTRNEMRDASGLTIDAIRAAINSLSQNQLLTIGAKRRIESFDADGARTLLLDEENHVELHAGDDTGNHD